jgi:hypothetical protein
MASIGTTGERIGTRRRGKDSETLPAIFSGQLSFAKHDVINKKYV